MRRREIGSSGIEVPVVGLGCNNFGGRIDEAAARAVIDAALDAGVTFFDTADVYGNRGGSEEIIGRALEGGVTGSCSRRSSATTSATARRRAARPTSARRSRRRCGACAPTASTSTSTTAPTASRSRRRSARSTSSYRRKVRAVGSSNFTAAMVEEARAVADERRVAPFVSEQSEYSWLARGAEAELLPACERLGIGFIPYFPLASGLLTGRYRRGEPPPRGTRLSGRTLDEGRLAQVERLEEFAGERGVGILDVAIGGLLAQPAVVSVIAGATKPEQVRGERRRRAWEPSPG